jgi:uncharacterized protein
VSAADDVAMTTKIDRRTGLEELDRVECPRLVASSPIGRLAVVVGGRPLVHPVNFALDGQAIVLRTDTGTKLHGARNGPVAFECDGVDSTYHTGWSVVVQAKAEEVVLAADVARFDRLPLGPWCPGPKPTWLRLRPQSITGQRIPPHGRQVDPE